MNVLRGCRPFRILWTGQVVSVVGDGMQRLALLWWAAHEGHGALVAVLLAAMVPIVVASPWGGILADRGDRRRSMLVADLSRAALTAGAAALMLGGQASVPVMCALVALTALGTAAFDPAYAAAVPSLVDPDDLPSANGLNMANSALGGVAGPLAAGALLGVCSVGVVLAVDAATFVWSAVCVARVRLPRPAAVVARDAGTGDAGDADGPSWRDVARDPLLRALLGLAAMLNMVVAPVPMLIALLAVRRFHAGSGSFGLLEMMISAGMLAGALAAGRLARGWVAVPLACMGATLAVVGVLPLGGAAAALAATGVAIAVANTSVITLAQRLVPPELHGRVFGIVGALSEALRPAGLVLGAPLAAAAGTGGAFVVIGALVVAATAAWARRLPRSVAATGGDREPEAISRDDRTAPAPPHPAAEPA